MDVSSKKILNLPDLHNLKPKLVEKLMADLSLMILSFTAILNLKWAAVYSSHWNKHLSEFQVKNPVGILFELN